MKFALLCETLERVEATPKRLEMMAILGELLKKSPASEIDRVIYLLQGGIAPPHTGLEVGLGEKFVAEAIGRAAGGSRAKVERDYKETGDLGLTAERLLKKKPRGLVPRPPLTVAGVYEAFEKMAKATGPGSQEVRIGLLTGLLASAGPGEGRYLARIPVGRLRLGVGDATILDALSAREVGDKSLKGELERAYNLCSDLGLVARTSPAKLRRFKPRVGSPIRPALAERLPSPEEVIQRLGPCMAEAKYDGFRIQVHKEGDRIELFSRRLEKTTPMFPEIVAGARKQLKGDVILEGEALSYNEETGEYLSFQETMRRKRKHGVAEAAKDLPLRLFAFDILYLDGEDLTGVPYGERRKRLENALRPGPAMVPAEARPVSTPKELRDFFEKCVAAGLEGVIAKDLKAPYVAGARKFAWVKMKRSYQGEMADTVDLAVVGYYKGRGQRAAFGIGTLLGAVYEPGSDTFKTVARMGSGLTEEEMVKMKELLDRVALPSKPKNLDSVFEPEPDIWCEPRYVVEVAADEVTRSPQHTCGRTEGEAGYALRFPRIVGWVREDRRPDDVTTVQEIIELFRMQKRKKIEDGES